MSGYGGTTFERTFQTIEGAGIPYEGAMRGDGVASQVPWLTEAQLARLFGTTRAVIARQVEAVFATHEVDRTRSSRLVRDAYAGDMWAYSLDVVLAVGWRMGSARGVALRRWATEVLGHYVMDGHAELHERLDDLGLVVRVVPQAPAPLEGAGVVDLVRAYAPAFALLAAHESGAVDASGGHACVYHLGYEECRELVALFNTAGALGGPLGHERGQVLRELIDEVTAAAAERSAEAYAAALMCAIVWHRPLTRGNERLACCVLARVLDRNFLLSDGEHRRISDGSLASLVALAAASPAGSREIEDLVAAVLLLGWP